VQEDLSPQQHHCGSLSLAQHISVHHVPIFVYYLSVLHGFGAINLLLVSLMKASETTQLVAIVVMLQTFIQEGPSSNLSLDTGFPDCGPFVFFPTPSTQLLG
jgi:hypothetical protein